MSKEEYKNDEDDWEDDWKDRYFPEKDVAATPEVQDLKGTFNKDAAKIDPEIPGPQNEELPDPWPDPWEALRPEEDITVMPGENNMFFTGPPKNQKELQEKGYNPDVVNTKDPDDRNQKETEEEKKERERSSAARFIIYGAQSRYYDAVFKATNDRFRAALDAMNKVEELEGKIDTLNEEAAEIEEDAGTTIEEYNAINAEYQQAIDNLYDSEGRKVTVKNTGDGLGFYVENANGETVILEGQEEQALLAEIEPLRERLREGGENINAAVENFNKTNDEIETAEQEKGQADKNLELEARNKGLTVNQVKQLDAALEAGNADAAAEVVNKSNDSSAKAEIEKAEKQLVKEAETAQDETNNRTTGTSASANPAETGNTAIAFNDAATGTPQQSLAAADNKPPGLSVTASPGSMA